MTNPTIKEHNIETGEVVEREMTTAELVEANDRKAAAEALREAEATKATAKAQAEAKLAALGLTADDLKALGL